MRRADAPILEFALAQVRPDRALALSRWIAGGITRVGAAEKARLTKLGLRVVDASQEGWGIVNHDLFLSNSHVR